MKKEPIGASYHLNAEEVVQRAEVLNGELSAEASSMLAKELGRGSRQDDVVDVEQEVSGRRSLVVDKQGDVGASSPEPKLLQKTGDPPVPGARGLLQPVQRAGE